MKKIFFSTFLSLLSFSCAMASASAPQKYVRERGATPEQIQAAFDAAKAELCPSPMFSNPSLGLRKSPAIRPSRATGDVSALWAGAASFLKRKQANEESDERISSALNEGWSTDSDEEASWSSDEEEGEISIAPMAGYVASQDARRMDILAFKRESDLLDAKIAAMSKKRADTTLAPHLETMRERTQTTQRFFEENPQAAIPVARTITGKKLYSACRTLSFQEITDPNA